jgi:hypothetical protein
MLNKLKLSIKALILKAIDRILIDDLYMAYHGDDLYFLLSDLDKWLRNHIKYNPNNLSSKQIDILDKARDELYRLMEENGIDWDHVE